MSDLPCLILLYRWDKTKHDAAKKYNTEFQDSHRPTAREKPTKERKSMKEQAQRLLDGKEKWAPTGRIWEDVGEAKEVEW